MSSVFIKSNSRKTNKVVQLDNPRAKGGCQHLYFFTVSGRKIHNFVTRIHIAFISPEKAPNFIKQIPEIIRNKFWKFICQTFFDYEDFSYLVRH